MALEATHVAQFVVAAVYVALAVWLTYLNFPGRLYRILALVFALRGMVIVLNQLTTLDVANFAYWHNVRTYLFIATPFAILDFLIVYTWRTSSRARRGARRFLLGVLVLFEVAYMLDHDLFWTFDGHDFNYGALGFAVVGGPAVMAAAAFWFAKLAADATSPVQARFHRLFSLGFATASLAETAGTFSLLLFIGWENLLLRTGGSGTDLGATLALGLVLSSDPVSVAAVTALVVGALRKEARTGIAWFVALPGFVLFMPIVMRLFAGAADLHSSIFFSAVPRVIAAAILGYALVRQVASGLDVFALDVNTSFAIRSGTVGGILIAFFFVISETAANLFGEFAATQNLRPEIAQVLGIVGAGVLLVFLHPLNRLGERLATGVLPDAKPIAELDSRDRVRIYKEQVELAWADGSITRKERLLLDKLREQLNLPLVETVRLESKAARASGSVPG